MVNHEQLNYFLREDYAQDVTFDVKGVTYESRYIGIKDQF